MRIQSTRPTSSIKPVNTPLLLARKHIRSTTCLRSGWGELNCSEIVRAQLVLKFAICAALIAITWAVFGLTVGHEFVNFDDPTYVSENDQVRAGLSWRGVALAFTHIPSHN